MSTEVYTLREDKQEIQKQLGCMNGIFQLFDRRYLLGQRRQGHLHKKLPQGQNGNAKELNTASEKHKEKTQNNAVKEKHRVSVESSRNSFSSSCSSLDCSKRVQTEASSSFPSIISEPTSPTLHKKQEFSVQPADIRDVVKDSMTRKPRVVSVKPVSKDERKGPAMTHVDSPRPLQHPKPVSYERKDQNLAKLQEIAVSRAVKDVKETSRFSYDGRESPYKLKSSANIKEHPRLSLDSKQSSIKNRINVVDQSQTHEPGSNKRPSSSVVARLMGLEVLNDFTSGGETLKIKPLDEDLISVPRLSRKSEETKHSSRAPNALTRIPLEPAPWKQEKGNQGLQKLPPNKKARERADQGSQSVYGQIEKRLTEVEFKKSGKDLRALKQILEAIQRTKMRLENTEQNKSVQPVSPTIKIKPANLTSDSTVITNLQKVKRVNSGRRYAKNVTPTETKAPGRTKKPVSPSHTSEYLKGENYCNSKTTGAVSPRLQNPRNGSDKQSIHGIRKQSNGQLTVLTSKTRDQSCRYSRKIRNSSQEGETVSYPSESDASVASQNEQEVTSNDWTQENKNKFAERLMGYKPMTELAMLTMEQPSPVSVLDAFYTEDTPSPIKKKSYGFKDDEDLCLDEQEWSQVGIDNLVSSTQLNHSTYGFNLIKLENVKNLVHQIELLDSTSDGATVDQQGISGDHIYIKEILLASGLLKLDGTSTVVHFHPTGSLINPELFNVLEETKECTSKSEKIKRKLIFDIVYNILVQKLDRSASSELWTSNKKGRILNGEKLLEELCLEINNLQTTNTANEYDEIMNIITEDVNKKSDDWGNNSNEVPALVLHIERLIFKDLISEIVNAEVSGPQEGHGRYHRQLFLM